MPVLEITNLKKVYQQTPAVAGVSFAVNANEIVGLLGPNGAGKTTTINMVLGILEPTAGSITINGRDVAKQRQQAMQDTNFAAVYVQVPGNLTVYQNFRVFGQIYSVLNLRAKIDQVIKEYDLEQFRNVKCGVLSSGEQTRVSLAKAMLSSPKLLLLDEPTASLDPANAKVIRQKIVDYQGAVLWTSHNMHEVAEVCDRVLFMSHGKILLEGDPKTLPAQHGKNNLEELFIAIAQEPLAIEAVTE